MSTKEFYDRWNKQIQAVPSYLYPWERKIALPIAQKESNEEILDYLVRVKPSIKKARWWYAGMTPIRSWKSVWNSFFGKALITTGLLSVYSIHAFCYISALQTRADLVQGDVFLGQESFIQLLWPWNLQTQTNDLVRRHDRSVLLYYQAKSIPWNIQKTIGTYRFAYPYFADDSISAYRYRSTEELEALEEQIVASIQRKKKVKQLIQRAKDIHWDIDFSPPYMDDDIINTMEQQITRSEELYPLALDYQKRANAIEWDLTSRITKNPYIQEELDIIKKELTFSEEVHSVAMDLNQRMSKMNWEYQLQPPYTPQTMEEVQENVEVSEEHFERLTELVALAKSIGWDVTEHQKLQGHTPKYTIELVQKIDVDFQEMSRIKIRVESITSTAKKKFNWELSPSIPYKEAELLEMERKVNEMDVLQSKVVDLQKRARKLSTNLYLRPPYSKHDVQRKQDEIEELERLYPKAIQLVRKLKKKDVSANIKPPYGSNEVNGLEECLRVAQSVLSDLGDDCECQYSHWSRYEEITCRKYDPEHPKIKESLKKIKNRQIRLQMTESFGYTQKQVEGIEKCLEASEPFDDYRVRGTNCKCTFNYNGNELKELTCDKYGENHPLVKEPIEELRRESLSYSPNRRLSKEEIQKLNRLVSYVKSNNITSYSSGYRLCSISNRMELKCKHEETGQYVTFDY